MSVFRSVVGRLIYALIFLRFIKIFTFVFPKNGVQTADDEKNNRELHAGSSSEVENNKQNKTRKDWKYRTQWLNIINEKIESRSRAVQTELLDDVDLDDNSGTTADENPDGFDDDDSAGDRDDAKIDRQVVKSHRCINKAPEKLLPLPSITPSSSSSSVEKKISGGAHATPTNSKNNGANSTPLKRLMENNGKSPKKSAKTTANKSTSTLLNSATLGSAFDEVYKKIIEDFYRTTNFAIELGIAAEIETGSPSGTQIENTESSSFLGNLTGSRKTNINKKLDPTNSQPVNNSETTKTSQPLNIIPASSSNNKMSSSDEWEEVVGKKHSTSEKANKNTPQKEVTKKKIMTHEEMVNQANYKTILCRYFLTMKGNCPHGEKCWFAHGEKDLRVSLNWLQQVNGKNPKYKTEICQVFIERNGNCPKGDKCLYAHGKSELRQNLFSPEQSLDDLLREMEIASQVNYFDFEVDVELKEVEGSIDHGFQSSGSGPESSNNSPEPGANKDDGKPPTTPAALYKTQICRYFTSGFCANGQKCCFAHGTKDLREVDIGSYKTVLCENWNSGDCKYGESCVYAHGEHQLRKYNPNHVPPPKIEKKPFESRPRHKVRPPRGTVTYQCDTLGRGLHS